MLGSQLRGEASGVTQTGVGVSVGEDAGETLIDRFATGFGQVAGHVPSLVQVMPNSA